MKFHWPFVRSAIDQFARNSKPLLITGLSRLLPQSLIHRMFALYSATLLVFTALGVTVFLLHEIKQQLNDPQRDAVAMVELIHKGLTDSVVIGDYDTVRQTLARSVDGSLFRRASFIDLQGGYVTIESSGWDAPEGMLSAPDWVLRWVQGRLYDINRVVNVGGRDYGVLRLHYDAHKVASGIWSVASMAVMLSLVCLAVGMLVTYASLNRWLRSLDHLRTMERPLQLGGPGTDEPIADDAPIEIRRVLEMFNRTATLVREREISRKALDLQKFALDQHAIVSIADVQGNITYANDRLCAISGYDRGQLIGANHRLLKSGLQDPAVYRAMWRDICAGLVWHGDLCNQSQQGRPYWVNATIVPLNGVGGEPLQFISIQTDITDRKTIEVSLAEAKNAAEQANRAKSEFLANMSHEIRTPLNAILGMITLLKSTDLSERQKDYSDKINVAARSFLGLVNDILDFSKVEAGKLELDPRPFSMDGLLRGLAVILAGNVADKSIEVIFDIDEDLPQHWVGDDQRLQQVLINLCGNAIKFTDAGEVVLRISLLSHADDVARVQFEIQDSGIGIAADKVAMIFEGFTQAEASTTRRFGGTGLGLAISQRLVQLMGGQLGVESTLGQGSRFHFEMPLHLPSNHSHQAPPRLPPLDGGPVNVLLIESHAMALQVLRRQAVSLGWAVQAAGDMPSALSALTSQSAAQQPFRVVVLDWQVDGQSCWLTGQQLRQAASSAPLAVVVMVPSYAHEEAMRQHPDCGRLFDGVLVKPVIASMLQEALSEALLGPQASPSAGAPTEEAKQLWGMRILVAEDNQNNQQVVNELLSARGAVVTLADNGAHALDIIGKASPPFDVVLMDIQMPVMDGYTATHHIRNLLSAEELPVIAMTANVMPSDRVKSAQAGMNDHVGKPFDIHHLVAVLQRYLPQTDKPLVMPASTAAEGLAQALPEPAHRAAVQQIADAAGIDLSDAMVRMGGRLDIYDHLLRGFVRDLKAWFALSDEGDLLETDIADQDRFSDSHLHLTVHSLKGMAGMVSAGALATLFANEEQVLLSHGAAVDRFALVRRLRLACQAAIVPLQRLANGLVASQASEAVTPASPTVPVEQVKAALKHLGHLLEASDMQAFAVYEQLQQQGAVGDNPGWAALRQAMDTLAFDDAAHCCHRLLESIAP